MAYHLAVRRYEANWLERQRYRELWRQVVLHEALLTGTAIFILPFLWLVSTSLKPDEQIFVFPPQWLPQQQETVEIEGQEYGLVEASGVPRNRPLPVSGVLPHLRGAELARAEGQVTIRLLNGDKESPTVVVPEENVRPVKRLAPVWKNYADALAYLPEGTHHGLVFLLNTLYITLMNVLGVVFTSSLVAYSFARLRWPGRDVLFVLLLSTMMLPAAVTMVPVFLIYKSLGWVDTLRPLWVGSFFGGSPFYIFLLRQFFLTIPRDLEDAAKIDGCSFFGIYWRIMLPLIKPALAALIIMSFMGSWNDFMGPLIYLTSPEKMNLAYALQLFQSLHGAETALLMAASTLVILPVIVVFFFTQRHFIEGVTLTGIKG